ncbi:MAG: hypothetical protein UU22_C0017G0011 [Parcubacteria group bacterium GW2011_GWA2_40_8]|nr:MAG: hypothetical protein UU22_C0017G0011 [Parcubacteria group bacterium GW2011_GWA2_40_8]
MPKKSKKYIIFKLALVLAMPLAAGFFTFTILYPKNMPDSNLSTKTKNEGDGIIKPQENKGFLNFLISSFGQDKVSQNTAVDSNKYATKQQDDSLLPFDSILKSINPLNGLGRSLNEKRTETEVIDMFADAPEKEPAKSLYQYFIASSAVGFEEEDIYSAVQNTVNGNNENLEKVIAGYEGKLNVFGQLEPPALAIAVHEQSKALIENYIILLQKMTATDPAEAKKIWLSEERQDINTEANKIITAIQELEQQYNFRLPSDVLPTN